MSRCGSVETFHHRWLHLVFQLLNGFCHVQWGFKTTLKLNLNGNALRRALADFETLLNRGDIGLVYFSGHGAQGNRGENYLMPLDAQALSQSLPTVQSILRMMERASNRVNIIILDACRNVPERFTARAERGLAAQRLTKSFRPVPVRPDDVIAADDQNERFVIHQRQGNAILFAAAPGETAIEGGNCGNHGCFTGELLKALDERGLELYQVFQRVRARVLRSTRDEQAPWFSVAMTGDFYFNPNSFSPGPIGEDRIWRVGEMIPSHITDPEQIQRLLEIRTFQARRLARTMNISFKEAAWMLYGEEAGRLR